MKFSYYKNGILNTIPSKEITIEDFVGLLLEENLTIENIRSETDKDKRDALKKKLNYVTFGGTFTTRGKNNLVKGSTYASFDLDGLENPEDLKKEMLEDEFVHLAFVSPSGKGLKFVVKIPEVKNDYEYKEYWLSIRDYYDLPAQDEACKDVSRACFVSVDKNPYYNPDSKIYTSKKRTETKAKEVKETDRSSFEYRRIIALLREGKTEEEIFKIMERYSKWTNSSEDYKRITFEKAFVFCEEEKDKQKETETPTSEALEILKDEDLFKKMFNTELNKMIVGEEETRKVIGLCAYGGRLVENSQTASFNLLVNDDAGTGKDYTSNASLKMLSKELMIKKTRISPAVLNYWHNSIEEPSWSWDGKVLYLEDISETILNHEVFKVMCSSGSSASIVKDQKVLELEIKGKPVMIVTTATATPNPELTRRFVILSLDSSKDQTKEIMKRHSKFRQEGIIPVVDEKYKDAMKFLKRVKVKIPFADKIDAHFPHQNIIMRTNFPRFLDFISASASFHQFQREEEDGFIIAEGKDYDLARECFIKLFSNEYMIPLTINQKKIMDIFHKNPQLSGSISKLHASKMNFVSDKTLAHQLRLLCGYGLLQTKETTNDWNRSVESYCLAEGYKPNTLLNLPKYEDLCRITSDTPDTSSCSGTSGSSQTQIRGVKLNNSEEKGFKQLNIEVEKA